MSSYIPYPIDTGDIKLPIELKELVERMAKNTHDVWAQNQIAQGWIYGPRRNNFSKYHPDLIPYEELPEVEKEYYRNTSIATLKLILKLGFKIQK